MDNEATVQECIKTVLKIQENIQQKLEGQWQPLRRPSVEKKLPKRGKGMVLVAFRSQMTDTLEVTLVSVRALVEDDLPEDMEVTHWMPLPIHPLKT